MKLIVAKKASQLIEDQNGRAHKSASLQLAKEYQSKEINEE